MKLELNFIEKPFENIESKHFSFLLMMRTAKTFLSSMGDFTDIDSHKELEKFYTSLPTELLASLGYRKNKLSLECILSLLSYHLGNKNTYALAMETEQADLPKITELAFLRISCV